MYLSAIIIPRYTSPMERGQLYQARGFILMIDNNTGPPLKLNGRSFSFSTAKPRALSKTEIQRYAARVFEAKGVGRYFYLSLT